MIALSELNPHNFPTTPEIDANLQLLLAAINVVRNAYGIPMIVTSGLRSQAFQDDLIAQGKSNAPKSKHLTGQAVDIQDLDGRLWAWCMANMPVLQSACQPAGLFLEDKQSTPTWVHFQTEAPKSNKRIFIP